MQLKLQPVIAPTCPCAMQVANGPAFPDTAVPGPQWTEPSLTWTSTCRIPIYWFVHIVLLTSLIDMRVKTDRSASCVGKLMQQALEDVDHQVTDDLSTLILSDGVLCQLLTGFDLACQP